jgi:tRNA(Ile)-lysidine synthase
LPGPITDDEADALLAPFDRFAPVLMATSGGPDSTCLAGLMLSRARRLGLAMPVAATVDHGLRPASAQEARHAADFVEHLGGVCAILTWHGLKPRTAVQQTARDARHALLLSEARSRGALGIMLAHTLDDQAETVLMRIARGSGVTGLAAMRAVETSGAIPLLRPLLTEPKARLVATCRARGWPFVTDPSNADPRHERVRWRAAASDLAALGLTPDRMALLASRAARANDALDAAARLLIERARLPGGRLDGTALGDASEELAVRALGLWLDEQGSGRIRLERLETCAAGLAAAARQGAAHRRSLGGFVLSLNAKGVLSLQREQRRRGCVNPDGLPSLGNGGQQT